MKKKVLFYYKLFFAGGTEHSILKLIKKLYEKFDITVAYDEDESTDDVLKEIIKYARVVNLNEIDTVVVDTCIICSHPWLKSFAQISEKIKAKHYYYWGHILIFETYPEFEFYEDFMEKVEKFICVSEGVRRNIIERYPQLEEKCEIIDNYWDVNEIIVRSNMPIQFNVDNKRLNLVTVSRIAKDKGFNRIKWLCDTLEKNNISYDWYIFGTAFKNEVLEEIQSWFKENKNVHFLGYKNNIYPYMRQMDYLVLLSDRESWGLVITESLILGVPCIVSNFDGVENQIQDRENGIILDMFNTNGSYEERLKDIISLNKILKKNVKKKDYSREEILERWKKLL